MTMTKFSRINKQREEITMRVLEDMEKGGNEWKKPWVEASPLPPHNPVSGTQYSGRNFLYTYVYGMMRGYADPRWATEKQIKEMGWKIPENLQNGRGGINDELGVGIEHWGMYAYIPRVKKDGTPLTDKGGTQKFTRVRAVKENGVWGRYRKTFYALSGESFDSYLMTASEVCKKTLGMLEPEPPQPAKTKNLSQKTMSSREASNRLSDEIGVKPCTRDEGTVGDS